MHRFPLPLSLSLPLLLGGCSTFRVPPPAEGRVQSATVTCTETGCALDFSLRLDDFEGEPYRAALVLEDFRVKGTVLRRDGGGEVPTITRAEPAAVEYRVLGDHLYTAILLDQSGSIRDSDPHDARLQGAAEVVATTLSDTEDPDRIALLSFPRVYASLGDFECTDVWQPFTNDAILLADTLAEMANGEGNETPIYDSIIETAAYLYSDPGSLGANRAILIMTDGEDTDSHASRAEVLDLVRDLDIPLYIVGLGHTADFQDLQLLALDSGGLFFSSSRADLQSTIASLSEVLYSNVRMTLHTAFDLDSPPLEEDTWYRVTGTIHYQDSLTIPFDETFYLQEL